MNLAVSGNYNRGSEKKVFLKPVTGHGWLPKSCVIDFEGRGSKRQP
jgi:hypothetical protein